MKTSVTPSQQALTSPQPKRVLLAFLLAPLAGPLGISIGITVPMIFESGNLLMLTSVAPFIYLIATPVVYFFSFILGLPLFLLLHLSLGLSRTGLILGWAVVGVISLMCLSGFTTPDHKVAMTYLPFALGGAAVGFSFWGILVVDPNPRQESTSKHKSLGTENPETSRHAAKTDSIEANQSVETEKGHG